VGGTRGYGACCNTPPPQPLPAATRGEGRLAALVLIQFAIERAARWRMRRHGLPSSSAPSPARIGSGNDTAARIHTKRGAIIWISQLSSRWIV
jgi:hypothetical protein